MPKYTLTTCPKKWDHLTQLAQSFRKGDHSTGYTLRSVVVRLQNASSITTLTAQVRENAAGTNPVRDEARNNAAPWTAQTVTNTTPSTDTTAPKLDTATVNGATLTLTYDEALDTGSLPAAGDFTVKVAGAARAVSSVAVSGTMVTLTLASAVSFGETVTVAYAAGTNPVRDEARNNAAPWTAQTVTNTTLAPPAVSITAGGAVTEGADATFTVSASRAPSSNLTVNVSVTEMGSFITGTLPGTVTILASTTSAPLAVSTADDSQEEMDGSITATVISGMGYAVGASASASVRVTDNDGMDTPPPPASEEVVREVATGVAGRALVTRVAATVRGRMRAPRGFAPLSQARLLDTVNLQALQGVSQVSDLKHLLLGAEFAYALAAASEGPPAGDAWEVWGRGSWRRLSGENDTLDWEGNQYGFHLGLDRKNESLLMGVMPGYHQGVLDYRLGGDGELDSYLLSVHPYLAMNLTPHLQVWDSASYGAGDVEDTNAQGVKVKEDLSLWTGTVGLEGRVESAGGTDVALSGFASVASSSESQEDTRVYLLGIEAELGQRLVVGKGEDTMRPFLLVAGRHDAGDLESGTALEVGGGLEWRLPESGIHISLRGRTQVNSTANEEHGASGELSYDLYGDGLGLHMSLVPQYGGATTMRLDPAEPVSRVSSSQAGGEVGLMSELGYGLATGRGLLRPHGRVEWNESLRRFELGVRLESRASIDLELDLERSSVPGPDSAADHAGMVSARLRF